MKTDDLDNDDENDIGRLVEIMEQLLSNPPPSPPPPSPPSPPPPSPPPSLVTSFTLSRIGSQRPHSTTGYSIDSSNRKKELENRHNDKKLEKELEDWSMSPDPWKELSHKGGKSRKRRRSTKRRRSIKKIKRKKNKRPTKKRR